MQYNDRINYSYFPPLSVELKALSGVGNRSGSDSNEPLVIHNHLHMNDREIASLVTKHQGGNKRERHFR
jgi:hypothetical protein